MGDKKGVYLTLGSYTSPAGLMRVTQFLFSSLLWIRKRTTVIYGKLPFKLFLTQKGVSDPSFLVFKYFLVVEIKDWKCKSRDPDRA